jgi:transcriptional regulator with XRE-family HTH domain
MAEHEGRGLVLANLKTLRLRSLLTQRELADKAGVSRGTVVRIEDGQPANVATVRKLAEALGVTAGDLTGERTKKAAA